MPEQLECAAEILPSIDEEIVKAALRGLKVPGFTFTHLAVGNMARLSINQTGPNDIETCTFLFCNSFFYSCFS